MPTMPRTSAAIWSIVSLSRMLWRPANSRTLPNVPIEVLLAQLVIGADDAPLQHGPEGFHAIGLGGPPDVLTGAVVDRLVIEP